MILFDYFVVSDDCGSPRKRKRLNKMPLISVIVPVYKVEPYLRRCVDSILAQTFADYELILIDDGSPDNCGAICDKYADKDKRIHVIHQNNRGLSAARNAGIDWAFANSDSEWICFIDSDDWIHPSYLESLFHASYFFEAPISQCTYLETDGTMIDSSMEGNTICVSPEEQYLYWYAAFAWGKLYKKSIFYGIRYPVGKLYEDVTIWYKILFSCEKIAIVNRPLYFYYQRCDSIVGSEWKPAKLAQIEAWEEQVSFIAQIGNTLLLDEALQRSYWVMTNHLEGIQKTNLLSKSEKKTYSALVRKKMIKTLKPYKEDLKIINLYSYFVASAYPKRDWLYWTSHSVIEKIKRVIWNHRA